MSERQKKEKSHGKTEKNQKRQKSRKAKITEKIHSIDVDKRHFSLIPDFK